MRLGRASYQLDRNFWIFQVSFSVETSPFLEKLKKKGYEVLYMVVTEYWNSVVMLQ